ncbi:hypothetical protein C9374_002719 [Naegleria lovaniensis]|uniref:mRNA 5'-phosphatase n=1 Tax=Naegleria lovaniensis TaxID=51637 RepID=A0AA88KL08_NAELO|nr:uncharacterized protein C9374_002719 [Naegleria lovaniensis]KAG2386273.1 hypothetical protein C9374_002719 [Naegleria lovaniensis]
MNPHQQPPPPFSMYASLLPQQSNNPPSSVPSSSSSLNMPPMLSTMMYSPHQQSSFPPPPPPRGSPSTTVLPPPTFNPASLNGGGGGGTTPTVRSSSNIATMANNSATVSSIPPPTFMPAFGMMMPGFQPTSAMGGVPMNAFPSSKKRSKESSDEEEEDEEEEEDQQPIVHKNSSTPTKPHSSPSMNNTVHQFMPQQYSNQPTLSSTKGSNTQSSSSTQMESLNSTNSSASNTPTAVSSSTQPHTQPSTSGIPQKSIYHPFISSANALFGNEFICDESIRKLGEFINQISEDGLEIEGKIGLIVQKGTQERISPRLESGCEIVSESIIQRSDCEFMSRISQHTFKHVNKLLNDRFSAMREAHKRGEYHGPLIEYKRAQETDKFFAYYLPASDDDERDEYGQLSHKDIRVTFDTKTDKPIRAMIKTRLERGDIDFSCPHRSYDFRVSFRKELSIDKFPNLDVDRPKKVRKKDRVSYIFGFCRIDLTSVDSFNCKRNGEINEDSKHSCHEIEVECDVKKLFQVKSNLGEFVRHLKEFLDTMRMLCLVCDLSPPPPPQIPLQIPPQQHYSHHQSANYYHYQPTQQYQPPPQHPPSLRRK